MQIVQKIENRLLRAYNLFLNQDRVRKLTLPVGHDQPLDSSKPVLFYNASTRLSGLSQNAGFSLVTKLALRQIGIPVVQFVCHRGLSHCVLGTDRKNPRHPPPCRECVRMSKLIFQGTTVEPYAMMRHRELEEKIKDLPLQDLLNFEYGGFPVGSLVLPSLRWILRRHHLLDDEGSRYLAREYILSAWNVREKFTEVLAKHNPKAVVVFNGMFYPEAVARQTAREWGIPVYSHEVGMRPLSAFFTEKDATAYPVQVDEDFALNESQEERLNEVLQERFQGKFKTAGVEFWPEMAGLGQALEEKIKQHSYVVPVFTNVIFDTSQSHANVLFDHMFEWLDLVIHTAGNYPQALFVIRAHPDEIRPGKESRESVSEWVAAKKVRGIDNVVYIPPDEYSSSYELVQRAKFVMVYNSTIGLEASMMGKVVLCAGKARYTQIPTVFFPASQQAYREKLEEFLQKEEISPPESHQSNARRVFYSQYFRASLPFDEFLEEDGIWRGYVRLKKFDVRDLLPDRSSVMRVLVDGILEGKPFIREL